MKFHYYLFKLILLSVMFHMGTAQAMDVTASSGSGFLSSPGGGGGGGGSNGGSFLGPDSASGSDDGSLGESVIRAPRLNKKLRRFRVSPYVGASATYSDNVGLTPNNDPNKESGMIYNANVGVNANYLSQNFDAVAGVDLMYVNRSNGTDEIIPSGQAGVSSELVRNLLFVDAVGTVTGLRGDARGANALSGAANTDYDLYLQGTISPYLRHQFGNLFVGELRYGYDYGGGTADTIGEIQSHTYSASFGTSNNSARLNVNGSVSYTDISFDNEEFNTNTNLTDNNDSTQLTSEVTATYALTRKLTAIAQVGHDRVEMDDAQSAEDLSGVFYNAGLQYVPNPRLRMTARLGERNDTTYYLVDGNYNLTKQVFIGMTAISQLMTAIPLGFGGMRAGTAFDEIAEGQTVASSLAETVPGEGNMPRNDGVNVLGNQQNRQLFRSQALNAFAGMAMRNGSFGIAYGYENRNYNRARDEIVQSVVANYRHDFTRQISLTAEGFYSDLDSIALNSNQTYGVRLLGNYALNDQLNVFASIGRNERHTEFPNSFDFVEHNVSAGFTSQF